MRPPAHVGLARNYAARDVVYGGDGFNLDGGDEGGEDAHAGHGGYEDLEYRGSTW